MEVVTPNSKSQYSHYEDNILIKPYRAIASQVYLMIFDSLYLAIVGERRSFNPHITVMRSQRWQKETISTFPFQLVEPITSIALIHSQLTPEEAKYNILSSVPLPNKINTNDT